MTRPGAGSRRELFWVDEQGELFASVSSWSSLIVAGAEPLIGELLDLDEAWRKARAAKLAAELAEKPPAAGLAFTNVRLYDSERRRVQPNATVVVQGDRIVAVGGPRTKVPPGARVIQRWCRVRGIPGEGFGGRVSAEGDSLWRRDGHCKSRRFLWHLS